MSSNTHEEQELLRLFKCVVDTGADVLVPFAKYKLLKGYNNNFESFLDDKKHKIFHIWQSKKLSCCECPPAGYNHKRTGNLHQWIFKKLYSDSGNENKRHIIRNSGKVVQVCLHKYVTQKIGIHELDISALSFLLRNLAIMSPNETAALDAITTYRSQICHAYSTNCYPMTLLNTAWTELENALVDLTNPSYKSVIRKQIKYLRKLDLDGEEIKELLKNVQECMEEVKKSMSSNNNVIEKGVSDLNKIVVNESRAIQNCLLKESSSIKQTQEDVIHEIGASKADAKESDDKILEQIGILKSNQASSSMETNDHLKMIVTMLHQISNTTFSVNYEQSIEISEEVDECHVLWELITPESWNATKVEQIRKQCEDKLKDMPVKIKFVRKGSLVIMTTVSAKVLKDSTAFQSAIKEFLSKLVEMCQIDTNVSCNVDVTLHILNSDELKVPYIPTDDKDTQTDETDCEDQIRTNKHWKENDKFDVAFLNGDDEMEIEWVHNISRLLDARYDIKCAVARDYLYGFPIKRTLYRHLNMFRAVIITLTNSNKMRYSHFIDENKPLVCVDLDYVDTIPFELWKFQYINCTICEHIWFPRLVDTLNNYLPGDLRLMKDTIKEETDDDCKRCKSTAAIAVYHRFIVKTQQNVVKIFCGSLTDEQWILDFINYVMLFHKIYRISSWHKQMITPFEDLSPIVYVLHSPNLLICPSIGEHIKSVGESRVIPIKITREEIPNFFGIKRTGYDATNMTFQALARNIFPQEVPY